MEIKETIIVDGNTFTLVKNSLPESLISEVAEKIFGLKVIALYYSEYTGAKDVDATDNGKVCGIGMTACDFIVFFENQKGVRFYCSEWSDIGAIDYNIIKA